jgi:hypothetical protein
MSTTSTASSTDGSADRRPTRRTVTRAVAWTVPVVAASAAAPAYAASPCDQRLGQVLDWDGARTTFTRTSNTAATAALDPDGAGPVPVLTLGVAATYTGNMKAGYENSGGQTNPNFRIAPRVGGLGRSGISLWQATTSSTPQGLDDLGTYTFTFSRPVTNLQFTITDIDSQDTDFLDLLRVTGAYTVVSKSPGVVTTYDGQNREYFYQNSWTNPSDNVDGNGGNLTLRFAGPLTQFSIAYSNYARSFNNNLDQDQAIYVSDLTFDYKPC